MLEWAWIVVVADVRIVLNGLRKGRPTLLPRVGSSDSHPAPARSVVGVRAEHVSFPIQNRAASIGRHGMTVRLKRGGQVGMAESSTHLGEWCAGTEQLAGVRVTKLMQVEFGQANIWSETVACPVCPNVRFLHFTV